jgi:uncharacterized membrane protein YciS (DUF1049 family)
MISVLAGKATFSVVQVRWISRGTTRLCKLLCEVSDRDIVLTAGQNDQHLDNETVFVLYRVMTLIWILFGLGYLMMIFGYLTAFLRSKKVARIERKLANNIKLTQSKLWSSLTRDVNYLRRILNEMYVMTLKVNFSLIITS